jgi:hypothetical protein
MPGIVALKNYLTENNYQNIWVGILLFNDPHSKDQNMQTVLPFHVMFVRMSFHLFFTLSKLSSDAIGRDIM